MAMDNVLGCQKVLKPVQRNSAGSGEDYVTLVTRAPAEQQCTSSGHDGVARTGFVTVARCLLSLVRDEDQLFKGDTVILMMRHSPLRNSLLQMGMVCLMYHQGSAERWR